MQKLIYICAPYRGDTEANVEKARLYCMGVLATGNVPICPHTMFSGVLNDNCPEQRETALKACLGLVRAADEVWQFGNLTEGMTGEVKLAKRLGIPVIVKMVED